jgi:hypothetical protein
LGYLKYLEKGLSSFHFMIWSTLSISKQAHFEILPGFWGYLEHLEKAYIILRTFHAMEYLHWVSWETWGIQGKLEYLEKGLCWENFQDLGYLSRALGPYNI